MNIWLGNKNLVTAKYLKPPQAIKMVDIHTDTHTHNYTQGQGTGLYSVVQMGKKK